MAIACGTLWGTSKEYAKLRKRTIVALPNLFQTAGMVGVRTGDELDIKCEWPCHRVDEGYLLCVAGFGAAATYFCTVHMMQILHHSTTVNCQTPSEVVNTAGGAITGEFGLSHPSRTH